jgi:mannose/cellobiose epimerase-like protein (N-acyl-D-glucosamine 2-epimerase family)
MRQALKLLFKMALDKQSTFFEKIDHLSTVEVSKKKSQLLQLVDSRFFVDFAVDFSSDFSGEMEEFVQNGLKIFKHYRRSQQSTTWPIRDPATVYFFRES